MMLAFQLLTSHSFPVELRGHVSFLKYISPNRCRTINVVTVIMMNLSQVTPESNTMQQFATFLGMPL